MNNRSPHFIVLSFLLIMATGCSPLPLKPEIPVKESAKQTSYRVKRGDTLSAIARSFSVTALQLQYRNKISNPHKLLSGELLVIPDKGLHVPESFLKRKFRFIWPLKNVDVTSSFGARSGQHGGIDLRAPRGTHIHASADGVVHFVGSMKGYGKLIILRHADKVETLYAHNNRNLVNEGQHVKQGEVIARVGRTGNASGYHLHFEYLESGRQLNPRYYIKKSKHST